MIKGICESVLNRVYEFGDMTDEELRCKFFQKLQECIELCNNTSEIMDWIKNEGLGNEVNELLSKWLEDGTLEDLVNNKLFNDLKIELESKINDNKNEINKTNEQLDNMILLMPKSNNVDDTEMFANILNIAKEKSMLIKLMDNYILSNIVSIPNGIVIDGNNKELWIKNNFELLGDNIVKNVIFNGNNNCGSIIVSGDNCKIINNELKNIKNNNTTNFGGETIAIRITKGINNCIIQDNIFNTLSPYNDSSKTESERTARFIRVETSSNIKINRNIFKGGNGWGDTDYIHMWFNEKSICDNSFPFLGVKFAFMEGNEISDNTFYYDKVKSVIKVQASGIKVNNNIFIIDKNVVDNTLNSTVLLLRIYSSYGNIIKDNNIYNYSNYFKRFFSVVNAKDIVIENNNIVSEIEMINSIEPFSFSTCKNIIFGENNIKYYSNNSEYGIFLLDSCRNFKLINNNINIISNELETTCNFISCKNSTTTSVKSGDIEINSNIIESDTTNKTYLIIINSEINNINFIDNKSTLPLRFYLKGNNTVNILKNKFRLLTNNLILTESGSSKNSNICIGDNVFDNSECDLSNYVIYRSYTEIENINYYNNVFTKFINMALPLHCTGTLTNYYFDDGGYYYERLHKNTMYNLPNFTKKIGYVFLDTTNDRFIIWDGTNWKRISNGEIVNY